MLQNTNKIRMPFVINIDISFPEFDKEKTSRLVISDYVEKIFEAKVNLVGADLYYNKKLKVKEIERLIGFVDGIVSQYPEIETDEQIEDKTQPIDLESLPNQ